MFQKLLFLAFTGYFLINFSIQGQQKTTTKLNRHFIEIEESDSDHHQYNKMESVRKTGETVSWIFDLQNRMVRQSKKGINLAENFNQEIIETFDSANQLISQKILNLDNTKYVAFYYKDGLKKAQVIHLGNGVFEIWRNNPDSIYTAEHNDFEPGLDNNSWYSFLAENLRYPSEARRMGVQGTVVIALLVDETGNIKETEIANSAFVNSSLAKEALRVIKLFKGKFIPAKNINGEAVEIWFNLPIRFKLG